MLKHQSSAFEMLLENIEVEIDFLGDLTHSDMLSSQHRMERMAELTSLREQISVIHSDFVGFYNMEFLVYAGKANVNLHNSLIKLRDKDRTPHHDFLIPILQAVDDRKSKDISKILDKMEEIMRCKQMLKDADYETIGIGSDIPRWKNTAKWFINDLIRNGLINKYDNIEVFYLTDKGVDILMEVG